MRFQDAVCQRQISPDPAEAFLSRIRGTLGQPYATFQGLSALGPLVAALWRAFAQEPFRNWALAVIEAEVGK